MSSIHSVSILGLIKILCITLTSVRSDSSENNTFAILDPLNIPAHIQNEFIYYLSGYDFEGRPVFISEVGRWNFRKYVELGGSELENLSKHVAKGVNLVRRLATRTENDIQNTQPDTDYISEGAVLIVDMADFNYLQMASPQTVLYMLNLARSLSTLAELVPYAFIINVNFAAQSIINLAKPALGPIFDKFEFHGTNNAR